MTTDNQQFLSIAMAYIEAGKILATAETELKNEHNYNNIVAYLLFHAVELFYKYMINNKKGSFCHTHDLKALEKEYSSLYPGDDYKINHPFDFSDYEASEFNEGENELVKKFLSDFKPEHLNQHLRYPNDERTGGYSFSLDSSIFEDLKKKMLHVSC